MKTDIEKCIKCESEHKWNFIFSFSTNKLEKQVLIACCPTCSDKINNMVSDERTVEIETLGDSLRS